MARRMHIALILVAILATVPRVLAEELRAGVARVDLTPPLELKATLGGYGARMSRPAEGVHDRVFAKALVLTSAEKRFALVTADVLGFPPPVKRAVVERLAPDGWTAAQIMLLPSHSHTSIDMMQINPENRLPIPQLGIFSKAVYELTVDNLVQLVRQASERLVPVGVGTSRIEIEGWNLNRRRASGPVDRQLTVTRIDGANGAPLAVLVNWTAHPTFLSAEDMLFSGGWPGHLQRTLEAVIGGGVTVMYYNGAQGDQRPLARPDSGASRWEKAERYGQELALVAHKVFQQIQPKSDVAFEYHLQPIALPAPSAHPQYLQSGGKEYGLTEGILQQLLATMFPAETTSGSLRLGELVIVGVPGEMAAELGMRIKYETAALTAAAYPTIGGLANEWVSYILPREEYERGGYEASVSFYGATLGETITAGALAGVKAMAGSNAALAPQKGKEAARESRE